MPPATPRRRGALKLKAKELAQRLTGDSISIFGVSWTELELHRKVVRGVIAFLEDRRVLYYRYKEVTLALCYRDEIACSRMSMNCASSR